MSRRLRLIAIALLTLVGLGGIGTAGAKWMNALTISQNGTMASGGFAETHNSANVTEYAECGSNRATGFCTFVDQRGTNYGCFTTDAGDIAVIRSMTPESWFAVTWNDVGQCTYVLAHATSRTRTKVP
jgi:hypothetical protein